MYDIPILILTYNRPKYLTKLINKLKKIKPSKVYLFCDGPKNNYDIEQIYIIKNKLKNFNKKTKLYLKFLKKNHGIKIAPQKGIGWFFNYENSGIILEDDCIPSDFFFKYMKYILNKYKNNKKIYAVSGYNHLEKTKFGEGSYFLSNYFLCWGWGTWKRVWQRSDKKLDSYVKGNGFNKLKNKFKNELEFQYWKKIINNVHNEKIKTWDFQFMASMWKNNSYCILPNINMIRNIGFDDTSTTSPGLKFKVSKVVNFKGKIKDPKKLTINTDNENKIFINLFRPKKYIYPWRIFYKSIDLILQLRFIFKKISNLVINKN